MRTVAAQVYGAHAISVAGRAMTSTKELMRIAYRDPRHIPERLTLHATQTLAEPSREWAEKALRERPDDSPAQIADDLRDQTWKIAPVAGRAARPPFLHPPLP